MDSRLLAYAERNAPRYTSYPTAPQFSDAIGDADMQRWLGLIPANTAVSLYVHVPYCRELCWYCGCNTYAARRGEPVADFVDTLGQEIDRVSKTLAEQRIIEIHWGGGTPNILASHQFRNTIERLAHRFNIASTVRHAVELDPRFVDEEKARTYALAGVNRASFGVQDLNEKVQNAIGRIQPVEIVSRAVDMLRAAGIGDISMDLMYGLPHQTCADLNRTIELVGAMRPNRISLFGYAHVPWFMKRQRLIPETALPDALERFVQAQSAREALKVSGYVAVGLDHFALPSDPLAIAAQTGRLRRSFQGYVVQDAAAIIGLGPSAISTLPSGYAQNISEPGAWARAVAEGRFATARGHELSDDDRVRRRLIEQIMCDFEGDLRPLGGAAACTEELELLSAMRADGMVQIEADHLTVRSDAQMFCRLVAAAFDAYAQAGAARHSRAV